jgi:imidazolonepropionase-like amidohydrolase
MAIVLQNASVVTGLDDGVISGGTVVIEDGRIASVGDAVPGGYGPDATVLDCTGKTITPGIIDAHAHLVYHELTNTYDIDLGKSLEQATLEAVANAERLLRLGITTIRDPGTRANIAVLMRDAIRDGVVPGPRVQASKQIISVRGGLVDWHPTHIFGRRHNETGLGAIISGPWEARDVVREQVKDGVDWIKVEASGTGANPYCPGHRDTMSFEELSAVVAEATEKNRPVLCHAESRNSIVKGATAGARTIEHAVFMDDEGLEAVVKNNVAICPTLACYRNFAVKGAAEGWADVVVEEHKRAHDHHVRAIRSAYEAGVPIIAGSDAGATSFPHGENHEEICLYVELIGMTPLDAIRAATKNAAEVMGIADKVGTLAPGLIADLLVFDESPLEDIRVLMRRDALAGVFQSGRLVAGAMLDDSVPMMARRSGAAATMHVAVSASP